MKKLRVAIVFGGKSAEHEISLQSAKNIIDAIDKSCFEIVLLHIDKQGQWWYIKNINDYLFTISHSSPIHIALSSSAINVAIITGKEKGQLINAKNAQVLAQIDVVFPVVHGRFGEDGSLQGILRMANLPFVGSDVFGSAACMDKDVTKRLLRDSGLKVAPFITITRQNYSKHRFPDLSTHFGIPFFVKPANQGSSIGVSKVNNEEQFTNAVGLAFEFDHKVVIEKNIKGREIECAVLGNDLLQVSTCGEVIFLNDNFYSYNRKYMEINSMQLIIPAILDTKIKDMIRESAISAYRALGCYGMARVDVFLTQEDEVIINEINTIPGFTNVSMYPRLWQASGLSYPALISKLISLALEKYATDRTLKNSMNS